MFECIQSVGNLRPFPVEPGQLIFQSRNVAIDVVSAVDLVAPFQLLDEAGSVFSLARSCLLSAYPFFENFDLFGRGNQFRSISSLEPPSKAPKGSWVFRKGR